MHGAEGLPARGVVAAFRLLKDSYGAWKRFEASTPAGTKALLYIGLDKSMQTIRKEVQTKRLLEMVNATGTPGRWKAKRHCGLITN